MKLTEQNILQQAQLYVREESHPDFRKQIEDLIAAGDTKELSERFCTDLEFGTGGLRGIIAGGFNRMNPYIVQRATQGLANYTKKKSSSRPIQAVIAYDSRNYSDIFSLSAALVLCSNGIKTFLFSSLRPTPELSFTVRRLKADIGINITASHNPKEYNGYKVFWNDGSQVLSPVDEGIIKEVQKVTTSIRRSMSRQEAMEQGLLVIIDKELDDAYLSMICNQTLRPELIRSQGKNLKIVYTPLHGTGGVLMEKLLSGLGFGFSSVMAQSQPNGDFPNAHSPNPEEGAALAMAMEQAANEKADLVIATDPDADRIGIAVPGQNGFQLVTGNQFGALMADYIFSTRTSMHTLPKNAAFINTIVTTQFQNKIAHKYHVKTFRVLTGFKYICGKIREFEHRKSYEYIAGGEESYGFLVGKEVRDKDGLSAAAMIAEAALFWKQQGLTLLQRLDQLFKEFGYYKEYALSEKFTGQEGRQKMTLFMKNLRKQPPADFGGLRIQSIQDFLNQTLLTLPAKKKQKIKDLPPSDVLQYTLEDGSTVTVRPSGTEPKIKFYASCCTPAGMEKESAQQQLDEKINKIETDIRKLIRLV